MLPVISRAFLVLCFFGDSTGWLLAQQEWRVPAGGNTYPASETRNRDGLQRDGNLVWSDQDSSFAMFFHVDQPAKLEIALEARNADGNSTLETSVLNSRQNVIIASKEFETIPFCSTDVKEAGYVKVELRGIDKSGRSFGEIKGLMVTTSVPNLKLTCVATNDGNMFYWGRRGPSVHIRYTVPKNTDIEYAYSEIQVETGDDPIGSYFMANGFGEGYFGIQVNSEKERRVLFSVWSPFPTDDPKAIPQDQRIELLSKGPDVRVGEFGNEGSGGQSYLVYPWQSGRRYRFLTRVQPQGDGSTIYTSWFGDKSRDEWRLIASFKRPKTNTHLTGFHSFLENFVPTTGHLTRVGKHGNVWVCDTRGNWHECLSARFSVDATGNGGHRLDFTGGATENYFYLKNCGFFNEPVKPGTNFVRGSSQTDAPGIAFDKLPKE